MDMFGSIIGRIAKVAGAIDEERKKREAETIYSQLAQFLAQGEWRKADEETLRVMCKIVGSESLGYLTLYDCQNFPREELKIIDDLWVKHSNGKFGFSVQKKIYIYCGGDPEELDYNFDPIAFGKFAETVGWQKGGNWLSYDNLTFNTEARFGHLPAVGCQKRGRVSRVFMEPLFRCVNMMPQQSKVLLNQGIALFDSSQNAEAFYIFEQLLDSKDPSILYQAWWYRGKVLLLVPEDFRATLEALKSLERALSISLNLLKEKYNICENGFENDFEKDELQEILQEIIEKRNKLEKDFIMSELKYSCHLYNHALKLVKNNNTKDLNDALNLLKITNDIGIIKSQAPKFFAFSGYLKLKVKNYSEAIKDLSLSIKLQAENPELSLGNCGFPLYLLFFMRSNAYKMIGNNLAAQQDYNQVVSLYLQEDERFRVSDDNLSFTCEVTLRGLFNGAGGLFNFFNSFECDIFLLQDSFSWSTRF